MSSWIWEDLNKNDKHDGTVVKIGVSRYSDRNEIPGMIEYVKKNMPYLKIIKVYDGKYRYTIFTGNLTEPKTETECEMMKQ